MKKAPFVFIVLVVLLYIVMLGVERMKLGRVKHYRVTENWITTPVRTVAGSTIDASLATEFSLLLTSNLNVGIINMQNGRCVNLTVTNTGDCVIEFTNEIEWLPRKTKPKALFNGLSVFSFMQNSNIIYGTALHYLNDN